MLSSRSFWLGVGGLILGWIVVLLVVTTRDPRPLGSRTPDRTSGPGIEAPSVPEASSQRWELGSGNPAAAAIAPALESPPEEAADDPAPLDDEAEQRQAIESAHKLMRSPDPDERIEAIRSLQDLDPMVARHEYERILQSAEPNDDVRVEAYESLREVAEEGAQSVDVMIQSLRDRSASVRNEAATQLAFEDPDENQKMVPALRSALAREKDPDVRDSLESTLQDKDPEFAAQKARELDVEPDPDDLVTMGMGFEKLE